MSRFVAMRPTDLLTVRRHVDLCRMAAALCRR
ncbi:putative leader peptide [Spirillospora sp. CA-294931]